MAQFGFKVFNPLSWLRLSEFCCVLFCFVFESINLESGSFDVIYYYFVDSLSREVVIAHIKDGSQIQWECFIASHDYFPIDNVWNSARTDETNKTSKKYSTVIGDCYVFVIIWRMFFHFFPPQTYMHMCVFMIEHFLRTIKLCANAMKLLARQRFCTKFPMFMQNFRANRSFASSEKSLRYLIRSVFLLLKTYACRKANTIHTHIHVHTEICNLEKSIEKPIKKYIYNNERLTTTTTTKTVVYSRAAYKATVLQFAIGSMGKRKQKTRARALWSNAMNDLRRRNGRAQQRHLFAL